VEPDLARFRNSNPARTGFGFGENSFSDHRTIHLMKLMASTMLSSAIKRQYSSALPLLLYCLPIFKEICGAAMDYYFCPGNTKIVNTPLDRSAALVLSVIS